MPDVIVTTSWDDGHILDLKLADLLAKYALPATFYVCPNNREIKPDAQLKASQIAELSQTFEIGAHTVNHFVLTDLPLQQAKTEIVESRHWLEDLLGKSDIMFCYPRGAYNIALASVVQEAGFLGARTVQRFQRVIVDPFQMSTTSHVYTHYSDIPALLKLTGLNPVKATNLIQWEQLAMYLFDSIMQTGGVFHLWGHSWEIEKHQNWSRMEALFSYISRRTDVSYMTNAEVIRQHRNSKPS